MKRLFKIVCLNKWLPLLSAGMFEVGLRTKLGWEFAQAIGRIHFNPVIAATLGVRWLEGAVVSWAIKGDEFEEAITKTAEGAASAIDNSKGVARFAAVDFGFTNHLLGDFNYSVKDVADCTAKFTSRIVA